MRIPRFYQNTPIHTGEELELSPENHRHAVQVLRLKIDQPLILFNGEKGEYLAKIVLIEKRTSKVLIESFDEANRESPLAISLALAMIKPDKMDFAIQKAVEMGVAAIQPLYTQRSVIKIKANRLDKKMLHWNGVIIAACEQSGRTAIPELFEPKSLDAYLKDDQTDPCISMQPGSHPKIRDLKVIDNKLSLLIGPEGGFTDDEEKSMIDAGTLPISFGSRILRAETAVIAGLTACQQSWGDL